jgi:hypothetical protein
LAVGVYRLWRDGGYAVGALMAGLVAEVGGNGSLEAASWLVVVFGAVAGLAIAALA